MWNPCDNTNKWELIGTGYAGLSLPAPRFEVGHLVNQPGESNFENQDVLRLSHMIKDISHFTNLEWVIGRQRKANGYRMEDFSGIEGTNTAYYTRSRDEGIPVTSINSYRANGGRFKGVPVNVVPVEVNGYRFQGIKINWWDYFSLERGKGVSATDDINTRATAKPKGRKRGNIYSGKSIFLRVYLRAENPDFTEENGQPRWIYSGPSNEIVISNVDGILRIGSTKAKGGSRFIRRIEINDQLA